MRVGLLGEKLSHSLSPLIHNYIFKNSSINLNYELFEISRDNISVFKSYMIDKNINAVNITIPYKKIFLKDLDFISDRAKKIGAINLMYLKNNKFCGENTDYLGFKYTLFKNKIDIKNKKIVIIGRGGAALAVKTVLEDLEATEIISLYRKDKNSCINFDTNLEGDILINTTPVGMYPNISENIIPESFIKNFKIAIDLIYNPIETKFLKIAKSLNLKTLNGLDMLIEQAIKTDEILFDMIFEDELRKNLKLYLENYFRGKNEKNNDN